MEGLVWGSGEKWAGDRDFRVIYYRRSLKTGVRIKSSRENVFRMRRKGDPGLNSGEHRVWEQVERHRKECDQEARRKSRENQF